MNDETSYNTKVKEYVEKFAMITNYKGAPVTPMNNVEADNSPKKASICKEPHKKHEVHLSETSQIALSSDSDEDSNAILDENLESCNSQNSSVHHTNGNGLLGKRRCTL